MTMKNRLTLACTFALAATSLAHAQSNEVNNDTQRGEPVTPFEFNGDLRDLPVAAQWQPGDPITEAAKRQYYPLDSKNPAAPSDWITAPDLLSDNQQTNMWF